ncbi:MAG: hypothetical protein R6V49_02655 [Bacteroidales bacterium]
MKKPILLIILLFSGLLTFAQAAPENIGTQWKSYLHGEAGTLFLNTSITERLAIRQNVSSYYASQSSTGEISSNTNAFTGGIRWEIKHPNQKLGLSTGLRFTSVNTDITGQTAQSADFFYLRYTSDGTDTKFARVRSISETGMFIGIPLEVRYRLFRVQNIFYYVMAGSEPASFNIHNQTDIQFQDPSMEAYEDDVRAGFSSTVKNYSSTLYWALGCSINGKNSGGVTIEVMLPSLYLSKENFQLIEINQFSGLRATIQLPLSK